MIHHTTYAALEMYRTPSLGNSEDLSYIKLVYIRVNLALSQGLRAKDSAAIEDKREDGSSANVTHDIKDAAMEETEN